MEIACEDHVDAGKGARLAVLALPRVADGHNFPKLLLRLPEQLGVHQADLVQDEPPPMRHASVCLALCTFIWGSAFRLPAKSFVHGLALQVSGVDGFGKAADFRSSQSVGVAHQVEERADETQYMGFARSWRAMQEPDEGGLLSGVATAPG